MDTIETGGAAFPTNGGQTGLTVRDYFAARAMQGLIAAAGFEGKVDYDEDTLAESAYLMADAMIKARSK